LTDLWWHDKVDEWIGRRRQTRQMESEPLFAV